MNNDQITIGKWISFNVLLLLMVSMLSACNEEPLTPSQTVQHFWTALLSGDTEQAGQYLTSGSQSTLMEIKDEFNNTSVSFGKINIESNRAIIETTLESSADSTQMNQEKAVTTSFKTFLDKEDKDWKVNFLETRKSLEDSRRKKGISKLVDDLGKLGRDVTGKLGGVLKNWEDVAPEIKKDLETLGESVQKQLQDSIDKHGPELEKKIEEFSDSLNDALKEFEQDLPEDKQEKESSPPGAKMI